jgi:SAM-dependent methyltransferase
MKYLILTLLCLSALACKDPVMPSAKQATSVENQWEKELQANKSRDVWQRPSDVIDLLGDVSEYKIADIGAGTGFFSFRLLLRGASAIAIDIDPRMLEIIESFKQNLSSEMQTKLETRLALPSDAKIKKDEVDIILIINTIGYIENRIEYLKQLYEVLPDGGKILIVDFKSRQLPVEAPSLEYRVPLFQLEQDLANSGFTSIESNDAILDYQYTVLASK